MKTKISIIVMIILGSLTGLGQDSTFQEQAKKWEFTDVIYLDSAITKDVVFQKVRQWFSETFVSSKNVLDNADKDEGVLFGHGMFAMKTDDDGFTNFNIEIRCKNGKIKYTIKDFVHKGAYKLSALGTRGTYPSTFDCGPLIQEELPSNKGWAWTGRSKKFWPEIKDETKIQTFLLIQGLKATMAKESIKQKDSW